MSCWVSCELGKNRGSSGRLSSSSSSCFTGEGGTAGEERRGMDGGGGMDLGSHAGCELVAECTVGDGLLPVAIPCLCTTLSGFLLAPWGTAGEADLDDPGVGPGSALSSSLTRFSEARWGVALAVDLRLCGVGKIFTESNVVEMAKRLSVSSVSRIITIGRPGSVKRIKMARPMESAYVTVACCPKSAEPVV